MTENYREFLMLEYARKVAKSESMDFTKGIIKIRLKIQLGIIKIKN